MPRKPSNKKSKRTMKRGGCSCNNSGSKSIFSGGKRTIRGGFALGPASLTNYDPTNQYTYSLFDVTKDPLNPSDVTDTRQLPNMTGGKKRRKRKTVRCQKRRTLRGGADPIIKNYENNLISSSNTSAGAANAANIVTAQTADIYSPLSKPLFL